MKEANFYPGPSRVFSKVPEYLYEAYMEGIMSINHRSAVFMEMMAETKALLKEKLAIPDSFEIAFVSSATENWEIIAQSLTTKGSFHFFNGAFGEKWYEYASKLGTAQKQEFGINEVLPDAIIGQEFDVICVTQNETSNGTQVSNTILKSLRKRYTEKLIAIDVTSSIGGVVLDFENADYWYASVQKCLGLPAGLGLIILSPEAVKKAYQVNERSHYNSLVNILENTEKNQTQYTPNVLGIYLLHRSQKASKGIEYLEKKSNDRLKAYDASIQSMKGLDYLITNEEVRSKTVLTLTCESPKDLRIDAENCGIILGAGYGPWKSSTFRIANFPAIKSKEIDKLLSFLKGRFGE